MPSREWARLRASERETISAHQLELPIKLSSVARALGVKLLASTLPPGISGEIRPSAELGRFIIKVNRHDGTRRQRFSVAHEIAHFLLHREQIGRGISDDVLYRSTLSDVREAEANRLAADILMPEHLLAEAKTEAGALSGDELIAYMADRFGVSEIAMRIRIG